jgi:hypothetical protein
MITKLRLSEIIDAVLRLIFELECLPLAAKPNEEVPSFFRRPALELCSPGWEPITGRQLGPGLRLPLDAPPDKGEQILSKALALSRECAPRQRLTVGCSAIRITSFDTFWDTVRTARLASSPAACVLRRQATLFVSLDHRT